MVYFNAFYSYWSSGFYIFCHDYLILYDTELSVLVRTMSWNFSSDYVEWSLLSQSITCSASFSKVRSRSFKFLKVAVLILSPKLCKSEFFRHRSRSFRITLNNIRLYIELCWVGFWIRLRCPPFRIKTIKKTSKC